MSEKRRLDGILEVMIKVALEAGEIVLPLFTDGCTSKIKSDGSIVTFADTQGEAHITARLSVAYPDVAMLGEESSAAGAKPDLSGSYFCVDPIDGTKQFATGNPQWVIAIAYLEAGRPLAGVIFAPAFSGRLFAGLADFGGFEQHREGHRVCFAATMASKPKWHVLRGGHDGVEAITQYLPKDQEYEMTTISSAIKFGLIAVGEGDVFIRAGRVWDWDIAAGQAIIEAAGGRVADVDGQPLVYGQAQAGYRHPPFIAKGAGILN